MYFAPHGPKDSEAVDFDMFSVTPGAILMRRQKRKDMAQPPRGRILLRRVAGYCTAVDRRFRIGLNQVALARKAEFCESPTSPLSPVPSLRLTIP